MHHDVHGRVCSGQKQNDMHGENDTKPPHTVWGERQNVLKSIKVSNHRITWRVTVCGGLDDIVSSSL